MKSLLRRGQVMWFECFQDGLRSRDGIEAFRRNGR